MSVYKDAELSDLIGKTIKSIDGLEKESERVFINTECGRKYCFLHYQDCCESVDLNDFEITSNDLTGGLIISAEAREEYNSDNYESATWTFYDIQTTKGCLWMRWLGESNGFYSEDVSFIEVLKGDKNER